MQFALNSLSVYFYFYFWKKKKTSIFFYWYGDVKFCILVCFWIKVCWVHWLGCCDLISLNVSCTCIIEHEIIEVSCKLCHNAVSHMDSSKYVCWYILGWKCVGWYNL